MKIGDWDSDSGRTFIIAEAGCNHEGDIHLALDYVKQAKMAGADCVKFQVYNPDLLVHPDMPSMVPGHKTQLERMRSLQLTHDQYRETAKYANEIGIMWSASAFDEESVDLVAELSPFIKIASGEFANMPLLKYASTTGKPLVLSTGMADGSEEHTGLYGTPDHRYPLAFLHCISLYPAPIDTLAMPEFWHSDEYAVGYSDHTIGDLAPIVAVARGAQVIEKHFTILPARDRDVAAGDHKLSLTPEEFKRMASAIRAVENMLKPWPGGVRPDLGMRPLLRRDPKTGLRTGRQHEKPVV